MAGFARAVLAVAVVLVPGAFVVLVAWALGRTVSDALREAREEARMANAPLQARAVWQHIHWRNALHLPSALQ